MARGKEKGTKPLAERQGYMVLGGQLEPNFALFYGSLHTAEKLQRAFRPSSQVYRVRLEVLEAVKD